ncbi:MAG: putative toxin-antitoxin system toxin component, PIN family [Alphaproteobacteria bacterium]|nr:putative toxin-antitoxin system toxin component, PIN family [Alphaproteobacteria bacterium]MBF0356445.1 putative toxin-antitoxin system toxin component, PIN family [Alphaproteobacteria bacterium]
MPEKPVFVVDTNVLVSRLLLPNSVSAKAVRLVMARGRLLVSDETLAELADVLARPKFDAYVSVDERKEFLRLLIRVAQFVPHVVPVQACRDPKDDKFLALALSGGAKTIVTGDADLLALHPFRGVQIVKPSVFES